jgi:3',5'-cyclic AMP phosphodiesterase CpdA
MRIAHLSDPHFGTDPPAVRAALADWVREQAPDVLVLSGDVTQRATCAQYTAARQFLDALGLPHVLAIPGNHDIPLYQLAARAFAPYGRWQACFEGPLEPELDLPHALILGVKTTRRWRHKNGTVSAGQIERVAARLARATPQQLRVVVVHQPIAVTREQDAHDRLRGHADALAAWGGAGCDLVLGGHIHLPYVLPLPPAATGGRPVFAVQAGTALSTRTRAGVPNSVNLIVAQPPQGRVRRCTVERWDHSAATGQFQEVATHALELGPA